MFGAPAYGACAAGAPAPGMVRRRQAQRRGRHEAGGAEREPVSQSELTSMADSDAWQRTRRRHAIARGGCSSPATTPASAEMLANASSPAQAGL